MSSDFKAKELRLQAMRRGVVLMKLKQSHPFVVTDGTMLVALKTDYPEYEFTELAVRQVFDYLAGHGLASIVIMSGWNAKITSQGIDYLDGIGVAMEGVDRG